MLAYVRKTLIKTLIPVEKRIGPVHWPFKSRLVTKGDYDRVLAVLKPGDAIVTRTRGCLSNILIPGFWSHAALYVGDGSVVEATGEGVHQTDLWKFLTGKDQATGEQVDLGKDFVRVLSTSFATDEQKKEVILLALQQCGKPYDYQFEFGTDTFYCAEVVWWTYLRIIQREPFAVSKKMNISVATPEDLANSACWSQVIQVGGKTNG